MAPGIDPELVLYHAPFSRSGTVLWLLKELDVKASIVEIDITGKSATKNPDLLATNPSGRVPSLRDGDACVSQTGACVMYILEKFGGGQLQPAMSDAKGRGVFLKHVFAAEADIMEPAVKVYTHGMKLPEEERLQQIFDIGKTNVLKGLDLLEAELNGRKYLVNNEFSAADIVVGQSLLLCEALSVIDEQKHKSITSYVANLKERPAYKESINSDST